ncbi:XK-related protein 8 [Merluccius polli]|uniref:XK-related protein n=1 Tax=Merluccius polli TaxID=89951 RepID=A0AA47MFS0_MERPO|nr:XK-related protein 8 [Merluccius polli]
MELVHLKYSRLDFGFSCAGLVFFLLDLVMDLVAAVHFYRQGDFVYLGVLVSVLVFSSVLGQLFSWFWYRYENYKRYTRTETSVNTAVLKVLHLFQLGVYLRYGGVLEVAVCSFLSNMRAPGNLAPGNLVPENLAPGNLAPGNLVPENLAPGNLAPENLAPENLAPGNLPPENLVPGNLAPGNLAPENLVPENLAPGNLVPENLVPGNLVPENLVPENLVPENLAVWLSHDLAMLRLIETFSESAPQLILILTVILQKREWKDPVPLLKALGSASAIACSVTLYHRALRSFLPQKAQQNFLSSLLYFIWNLLVLLARLTALALFAYALPCYIFTHFLCWWPVLVFFVWRAKTSLMDSPGGEWLYRVTVGLIWYFSWFNVAEGRTARRLLLYHAWMLSDVVLLCGLAVWHAPDAPGAGGILTLGTVVGIVATYVSGLLVKLLYYKFFHPKLGAELKGSPSDLQKPLKLHAVQMDGDEVDFMNRCMPQREEKPEKPENRRIKRLAHNFYS